MMSTEIKLVIVPLWLSRIMGELGLRDEDLVDMEKLSGIVSPRDILIYREVNGRIKEVVGLLAGESVELGMGSCIMAPDAIERTAVYNTPVSTLLAGSTSQVASWDVQVKMVNMDTVMIKLNDAKEKIAPTSFIDSLGKVLHGRLGVREFAASSAGKVWINRVSV